MDVGQGYSFNVLAPFSHINKSSDDTNRLFKKEDMFQLENNT